jgi:hypothetical protein
MTRNKWLSKARLVPVTSRDFAMQCFTVSVGPSVSARCSDRPCNNVATDAGEKGQGCLSYFTDLLHRRKVNLLPASATYVSVPANSQDVRSAANLFWKGQ